jgi:hypothetical protein
MRLAGISAAVLLVSIFLGCMSIEIGGFGRCSEEGVSCQKGSVTLPAGATEDVYYPVAYCRPPNLELSGPCNDYVLVDQKEDHFQVRNTDRSCSTTVHWKARGVRAGPPPAVIVPGPSPTPAVPVGPAAASGGADLPAPTPITATPPDK